MLKLPLGDQKIHCSVKQICKAAAQVLSCTLAHGEQRHRTGRQRPPQRALPGSTAATRRRPSLAPERTTHNPDARFLG